MKRYAFLLLMAVFGLGLSAGCSGDDDDIIITLEDNDTLSAEEAIGPDGGNVGITDEVVLEIPEGALTGTIEFSITENENPAPIDPPLRFVSPCYTIEPSGTIFGSNAELSMTYLDSLLTGGALEDSIVIYTFVDSAWEPIPTTVDTAANVVSSGISHLTDFAAATDTTTPPVYAELLVSRTIGHTGGSVDTLDVLSAFFNSGYFLGGPYAPLQADSVTCNEFLLPWDQAGGRHVYEGTQVIELDSNYSFFVYGSDDVPELEATILFPNREPDITSPGYDDLLSATGFTVEWTGVGGGAEVQLVLLDSAGIVLNILVPNSGSHDIIEDDYTRSPGVDVELYLILENSSPIDVEGFHSESHVAGRVSSVVFFRLE